MGMEHGNTFYISGEKIEQFAIQTDFSNIHGVNRLRDILRALDIVYNVFVPQKDL